MTARPTPAELRDRAIVALLAAEVVTGGQLVALVAEDANPEEWTLRTHDKQGRATVVRLPHAAGYALAGWMYARGNRPGPLFWTVGQVDPGRRLTPVGVRKIFAAAENRGDPGIAAMMARKRAQRPAVEHRRESVNLEVLAMVERHDRGEMSEEDFWSAIAEWRSRQYEAVS